MPAVAAAAATGRTDPSAALQAGLMPAVLQLLLPLPAGGWHSRLGPAAAAAAAGQSHPLCRRQVPLLLLLPAARWHALPVPGGALLAAWGLLPPAATLQAPPSAAPEGLQLRRRQQPPASVHPAAFRRLPQLPAAAEPAGRQWQEPVGGAADAEAPAADSQQAQRPGLTPASAPRALLWPESLPAGAAARAGVRLAALLPLPSAAAREPGYRLRQAAAPWLVAGLARAASRHQLPTGAAAAAALRCLCPAAAALAPLLLPVARCCYGMHPRLRKHPQLWVW